jgi:hypothetical protein
MSSSTSTYAFEKWLPSGLGTATATLWKAEVVGDSWGSVNLSSSKSGLAKSEFPSK